MCKVWNVGGILLAIVTELLIAYGCWSGNKLVLFYWYWEGDIKHQPIRGIPLNGWGVFLFFLFNSLIIIAIICHIRASFADPGYIPKDILIPDYVDDSKLKSCGKGQCGPRWKPERAHHCSECQVCIFKVMYFLKLI